MLKQVIVAGAAGAALFAVPAAAQNANLDVNGVVPSYCTIRIGNASSGTASVAFETEQKIANLQLACNEARGTKLILDPVKGDLVNTSDSNMKINYAMRLSSSDPLITINTTDTTPGSTPESGLFTRTHAGYSSAIANGLDLQLFMNVNVSNNTSDGSPGLFFRADQAPAGTYAETFTFTVSAA